MSVRTKLIAGLSVELVVIFGMVIAILLATSVSDRRDQVVKNSLDHVAQGLIVERGVENQIQEITAGIGSSSIASRETALEQAVLMALNRWAESTRDSLGLINEKALADLEQQNLQSIQGLRQDYQDIDTDLTEAVDLQASGDTSGSAAKLDQAQDKFSTGFVPSVNQAIIKEQSAAERATNEAENASRIARIVPVVLAPIALLVGIAIAAVLVTDISRSLARLHVGVEELGKGNLDVTIKSWKDDEFGELAASFNRMSRELKKSTEALQAANRELEGYAHTVSHDLKGPLSNVTTAAWLLKESYRRAGQDIDPEVETIMGLLEKNVEKSSSLVEDLLALAEAGQVPDTVSAIDVGNVVSGVIGEHGHEIKEYGIEVKAGDELGTVMGNETQVYQIFSNLIGNAIKYNDSSEPVIEVSFLGRDDHGLMAYRVRDNGSGVDEDVREKVFTPFYRGEGGGTGIGLATVRKLVRVYGGDVRVCDESGGCFEFTMRDLPSA